MGVGIRVCRDEASSLKGLLCLSRLGIQICGLSNVRCVPQAAGNGGDGLVREGSHLSVPSVS